MLSLFLMLALGFLAGKTRVLTPKDNKIISRMVNCLTNPCNVLYAALCCGHTLENGEALKLLIVAIAAYGFLVLAAQGVPWLLRVPASQKNQYKYMMVFNNCGFMGIPVVSAVFGAEAMICVTIFIIVFYIFLYTYGLYLIRGETGGFRLRDLLTPMIVSSVLSLIFYLCRVQVGGVLAETMDMVRAVTTPCAMLVLGCALSALDFRTIFGNWRLYVVSLLKLLVLPAVLLLLLRPVLRNPMTLDVTVCIMGMPIATNFTMLSAQYDGDQVLASSSTFITTLVSVLTIPLLIGLLQTL